MLAFIGQISFEVSRFQPDLRCCVRDHVAALTRSEEDRCKKSLRRQKNKSAKALHDITREHYDFQGALKLRA